jgi:hypothetical protein
MLSNMCHIFLAHDVVDVSAMSFQVLESTARIYYAAFYEALLLNGQSFLSAATIGRKAVRAAEGQFANASVPTNYHHAAQISHEDFWPPKYHLQGAGFLLFMAYGVRVSVLVALLLLLMSSSWASRCMLMCGKIGAMSFATMIWHGSIRYMKRLQCPRWLWWEYSVQIFPPGEVLETLNDSMRIEHLVLEDVLMSEANKAGNEGNGSIYLYSEDAHVSLGPMVAQLGLLWVRTGFVDKVVVISAEIFKSPLSILPSWLRLRRIVHKSGLGRTPLLAITDFDRFYTHYEKQEWSGWEQALERMAKFASRYRADSRGPGAEGHPTEDALSEDANDSDSDDIDLKASGLPGKSYLIVTGSGNWLNGGRWLKIVWPSLGDDDDNVGEADDIISRMIGKAVPHLHMPRNFG